VVGARWSGPSGSPEMVAAGRDLVAAGSGGPGGGREMVASRPDGDGSR
jgi:hypothetical protein